MRLSNGFGSVYKESGNRRNKWRAVVTVGFTDSGKQKRKTIGYFATKSEAMQRLQEYNTSPRGIDVNTTFREVYYRLYKYKLDDLSNSSRKAYDLAYKYCTPLHEIRMVDIKTDSLLSIMESIKSKHGISRKTRTLLKQMFQYAIQNDIVSVNYADFIEVKRQKPKAAKHPFSNSEIETLFRAVDDIEIIDTILIMIYTGMRIGELIDLKKEDVNLAEMTIRCGSKTEAGINRLVPISTKIQDLIKNRMECSHSYLIEKNGKKTNYSTYRNDFDKALEILHMKHTPHECRHTFATLLDNAGANERAITKIMGHTDFKTTEKFYTHKDIDELRKAIDTL